METKDKIIELIKKGESLSVANLARYLGLSRQIIHRHLLDLIGSGLITKKGNPPTVYYSIRSKEKEYFPINVSSKSVLTLRDGSILKINKTEQDVINKNFLYINAIGEKKVGIRGFVEWCADRRFDPVQKAKEYLKIQKKNDMYKKGEYIDGMYKMKKTFLPIGEMVSVDEMYYLDFYSIEVFGKTKLGQMMLYAKQNENKKLINEVVQEIKGSVENFIKKNKIDSVAFVPPTIKRRVQFIKEIEKGLALDLPAIKLSKINHGDYIRAQKTLNRLEDRIENARLIKLHTMGKAIDGNAPTYHRTLVIDDALGSGATINEVARQLKKLKLSNAVIGLAITGSLSGFEVISEV